jgi:hypothetical protein
VIPKSGAFRFAVAVIPERRFRNRPMIFVGGNLIYVFIWNSRFGVPKIRNLRTARRSVSPVSASVRRVLLLLVGIASPLVLAQTKTAHDQPDAPSANAAVTLDVRNFGAIGDGTVHPIAEWKDARGRRLSFRELRRKHPFVDDADWSVDELAFELAKRALPPEGGTIHFPAGHYVTGKHPWRIWRDRVRITGDGAELTTLSTASNVADALSVSPYRHVGWLEGAKREYAFTADSGRIGDATLRLKNAGASREFTPGELVFIRNGACRFDQDYGEFNEIAAIEPDGRLRLVHPLSRDYTLAQLNWAAELAEDFTMPEKGRAANVAVRTGEGYFVPGVGATVSIGENLFRIENSSTRELSLVNEGRDNDPPGTVFPAGSKIAKSRSILKVTRTTRDFRCENLTLVGRRKILNLSNSYGLAFRDCVFVRDLRDGAFRGGLTIDGDGGRFARFDRCRIVAQPAIGMQFARSFGNVVFADCTFTDTNAAFTEFNFDCEVTRCTFEVRGSPALTNIIIAGKSCGDLRFIENRIEATNVAAVFDTVSDIHSQKHGSEGGVVVRGNVIETTQVGRVFPPAPPGRFVLSDNVINGR